MQKTAEQQRISAFLDEQLRVIDQKRTRLIHALDTCGECLEAQGLRASLANVELERDVLHTLMGEESRADCVSLEALIMQKLNCLRQTMERATVWRVGQRTPPAYWEAEIKRDFLMHLLSLYHAFEHDRPYYTLPKPSRNRSGGEQPIVDRAGYPWYHVLADDEASAAGDDNPIIMDALEERIRRILNTARYPAEHLEIIAQQDEPLLITGYAHSADIREALIELLLDLDEVQDVISDIKVVQPAHCPICIAQRNTPSVPSANGRSWLHRRLMGRNGRGEYSGRNGQQPADE